VARTGLPSFDLVVATVDRVEQLGRLLDSLAGQTHQAFRVLVVDQNHDDRVLETLEKHGSLELTRLRSQRGLSRARNAALRHIQADIVAFPDDDCVFAPDLLQRVARRFAEAPTLDGLTGRAGNEEGRGSSAWPRDSTVLTRENHWNRAISFTIFFRVALVARVGQFDEQLGLGAHGPWSSGEETDYLVRALDRGAHVRYDPSLVVGHQDKILSPSALRSTGARDGASIGYILRKHGYPLRTVGRMLIRPLGGALVALARRDGAKFRFHLSTLRGRLVGYRSS
jgi:glycosyltransferase involved in cell wall biosynthesis